MYSSNASDFDLMFQPLIRFFCSLPVNFQLAGGRDEIHIAVHFSLHELCMKNSTRKNSKRYVDSMASFTERHKCIPSAFIKCQTNAKH